MAAPVPLDPNLYLVTVAGQTLSGFSEGDVITVAPVSDFTSSRSGLQGDVAVVLNTDRRVTVTFVFLQTAGANDILSGIVRSALQQPGSAGIFDLLIQDTGGRTVIQGKAWVQRQADVVLGQEVGQRTWTITCKADELFIGGND